MIEIPFSLQEELTMLHRRKGENAQQVIDLTATAKANEVTLNEKAAIILSLESHVANLKEEVQRLKNALQELEGTNQLLKDEYTTLQLALSSAETKLVQAQKENDKLVGQIIELKERDVARMNQENDLFFMHKQEMVKLQLADAAREAKSVKVNEGLSQETIAVGLENLDSLICHSTRIPTKAFLKFDAHDSDVNAIKWSPHGLVVATAGADRRIKLWDISKGTQECRGVLSGSNGAVMSVDFDAAGTLLLASSCDFASRVWTLEDMRLRHTLTGHSAKILSAKFMGENTKVCSGSHDRTLKVWDLRSRACIDTLFPGSSCNDLVCLDQMIVSGHFDKKLRFYDVRSKTKLMHELSLNGKVTSVDLAKNGQSLLACTRDDSLNIIDLRSMKPVSTFHTDGFHVGCDWTRAVFSPESEYVSVGSGDGTVYIWNVNDSTHVRKVLKEHESVVIAVAWQPAGNSMTSCDKTKQVVVWADI